MNSPRINTQMERRKIHIDVPLSEEDALCVKGLNQFFEPKDFSLIPNKHSGIDVLLRRVNIKELEKRVAAHDSASGILRRIFKEIRGIGSYGLQSGLRVYVDYNQERKVKDRAAKEKAREKHFYANGHPFRPKPADLPEDYKNKILCGDSLDILKKLPDNCVDLIFTSPPYNFGLDYDNEIQDDAFWKGYFDSLFAIFDQGIRVLKYGGRFIVNVQPLYSDYIPTHHIISNHFMKRKMIWKGEIIWEKNNYNCKYSAWGSWKSPSNPYLKGTWEFLEIYAKGSLKKEGDRGKIDISAEEFKRDVISRWSIAPERKMKEYGHPAMFPEKLVERVLKLFSYQDDIVLDPFNGAGTTTYVAQKLNRHFLGIDISKAYCESAKRRSHGILV
ncbi:MAG: site-specific DNA-methyltransferase [Cytophagales bacterium]|nr:site-specific DNA-methyltransferase [Cytophagales bacterium]